MGEVDKLLPGYRWRLLAWENDDRVEMTSRGCFDELVVDNWLHIEQMNERSWWMQIGDAKAWVRIGKDGKATVNVYRGEYDDVNGETEV